MYLNKVHSEPPLKRKKEEAIFTHEAEQPLQQHAVWFPGRNLNCVTISNGTRQMERNIKSSGSYRCDLL